MKTVAARIDLGMTRIAGYILYDPQMMDFQETTPKEVERLVKQGQVNGLVMNEQGQLEPDFEKWNLGNIKIRSGVGNYRNWNTQDPRSDTVYSVVRAVDVDGAGRIYEVINNRCARVFFTRKHLATLATMAWVGGIRVNEDDDTIELCEGVQVDDWSTKKAFELGSRVMSKEQLTEQTMEELFNQVDNEGPVEVSPEIGPEVSPEVAEAFGVMEAIKASEASQEETEGTTEVAEGNQEAAEVSEGAEVTEASQEVTEETSQQPINAEQEVAQEAQQINNEATDEFASDNSQQQERQEDQGQDGQLPFEPNSTWETPEQTEQTEQPEQQDNGEQTDPQQDSQQPVEETSGQSAKRRSHKKKR